MFIPRFTVRWLLVLTTLCAVLAFVITLALRGQVWAIAVVAAAGSLVGTFLLYALAFCLAWGGAKAWRQLTSRPVATSPFATHTPPPQWLPPEDPD